MVMAFSVLLLLGGIWTARDMPVDVFPDLTAPTVTILTEGHGMAPEEMESLVTFPLESAINGASSVRRVRSATALGIAVVWVEFDWGTDIFLARQIVAEKLALVGGTLPPQVKRPVLAPVSSIMGEILFFAISSDAQDPLALRTAADTVVRRRLLAVAGVSQVTPIGGAERQYQVVARPEQLRANSISLTELLDAVRGASQNTSAGVYTEGPQEYVLQAVGRVRSPDELGESVVALRAFGSTINRMTLGGMAIAIGALVDDAIIDVENVVRRLRENRAKPIDEQRPAAAIVREATLEIRTSIVFATIIIVLVFLPIFGLAGVEGRLLTPLAFAYIVSLLASLLVAIIVTPALSYAFLPLARSIEQGHDGWLARTLKQRFAKDLPRMLDHPLLVMVTSAALLAAAAVALTRAGTAFLPEFHEGSLTIQANTLPGTSLAKSDEMGRRVELIMLAEPEVVATARRKGRAQLDEQVQGVEAAESDVGLRDHGRP